MRRDERGSVSLETALLMPALLAVSFAGLQAGVVYFAQSVAQDAATAGARAAARYQSSPQAGCAVAEQRVRTYGSPWLEQAAVRCDANGQLATVTVSGVSMALLPGLDMRFPITASGSVPIERLT